MTPSPIDLKLIPKVLSHKFCHHTDRSIVSFPRPHYITNITVLRYNPTQSWSIHLTTKNKKIETIFPLKHKSILEDTIFQALQLNQFLESMSQTSWAVSLWAIILLVSDVVVILFLCFFLHATNPESMWWVVYIKLQSSIHLSVASKRSAEDGSRTCNAASTCWDIKTNNPNAPSGTYWITSPPTYAAFQAYCE